MPNDNGKVIVSLLAGATAGIVAGLLLAPETGDEARAGLRESARKWGGNLGKLAQDALAKLQNQSQANPEAAVSEDRQTADALFDSMSQPGAAAEPGDLATPAGAGNHHSVAGDNDYDSRDNLDYDGDAGEGRHRAM